MALVYPDLKARALCAIAGTYNVGASNDQLSVAIDGGSNQVFTLTHGATRTATNIVSDLSALTGATASVITIGANSYVQIQTTSASGAASTIFFNAPANNCNTIMGWYGTNNYHGGAYGDAATGSFTFVGSTKQNIINGIETALLAMGWQTVSGHGTTNCLMQCSITPTSDGSLIGRVRLKDNGNTCVVLSVENLSGGVAGLSSSTSGAGMLNPGVAKTFKVLGNKHMAIVFTAASTTTNREYAIFGTLYIPSFIQGSSGIYECMFGHGDVSSDSDVVVRDCFRRTLSCSVLVQSGNAPSQQAILNGALATVDNGLFSPGGGNCASGGVAVQSLVGVSTDHDGQSPTTSGGYKWHDGSADTLDPILAFGTASRDDEALKRGLLYGAAIITEAYTADQTDTFNGHNWWFLTHNNAHNAVNTNRGTLIIATS